MAYGEGMQKLNPCGDALVLDMLRSACPDAASLLDLGCGRGDRLRAFSQHWAELRLFGIDSDQENINMGKAAVPSAALLCADARQLPFEDGAFDIILCECAFSLFEHPADCVAEIARTLRRGGELLLTDLYAKRDAAAQEKVTQNNTVKNVYGREVLENFFATAGFAVGYFSDRSADLTQMLGQMMMDGVLCDCLGMDALLQMKNIGTGYGLWLFRKQN